MNSKRAFGIVALSFAIVFGLLLGPEVIKASDDFYLILTPTASNPSAFRVNNTAGTSMFNISTAGTITVGGSFGATTFNPGVTLGAAAVTGTTTFPLTATGGADVFGATVTTAAAAAGDTIERWGDSADATEFEIFGDGNVTADGTVTGAAMAATGASGIALGAAAVTGLVSSPFTATGGVDTFLSFQATGAASNVDLIASFGDSGDSTEVQILGDGDVTADGTITGAAMAATGASGIALGAAAVTGLVSSPFTPTAGADVFLSLQATGAAAGADTIAQFGDSGSATLVTINGDGLLTAAGGVTSTATLTGNGIVVLGDGGDNFSVASDGIDITTAGAISNATSIAMGGALSGATTVAASSTISTSNGSVTSADLDGFNGNTGSLVSGVPTVRMDVVAGTTGAQDLILDNCEAGSAATWTPSGAAAPADADDAVTFRVGTGAVAVTYPADVGVGDSIETLATGANWDASADEYIFVWIRSTAVLSAGTLTLTLDDDTAAPDATVNFGAVSVANQWQLQRIDISAVADADKNVVANLVITSNHATELDGAVVVTFDQFVKVDAAESTALAFDAINQPGGIRSGFSFVEDAGNGTFAALVENTDYFIDYANNAAYWMTDQSTLNDILLYASSN